MPSEQTAIDNEVVLIHNLLCIIYRRNTFKYCCVDINIPKKEQKKYILKASCNNDKQGVFLYAEKRNRIKYRIESILCSVLRYIMNYGKVRNV